MNKTRRKFLKYLILGIGALPLLKLFGFQLFSESSKGKEISGSARLKNKAKEIDVPGRGFKIVEKDGCLEFYNAAGKKVLSIRNNGSLEVG